MIREFSLRDEKNRNRGNSVVVQGFRGLQLPTLVDILAPVDFHPRDAFCFFDLSLMKYRSRLRKLQCVLSGQLRPRDLGFSSSDGGWKTYSTNSHRSSESTNQGADNCAA